MALLLADPSSSSFCSSFSLYSLDSWATSLCAVNVLSCSFEFIVLDLMWKYLNLYERDVGSMTDNF